MPFRARSANPPLVLVAGGAGFLGSHLCQRLIGEGYRVHCIDSLYTGRLENLSDLLHEPRFSFAEQDVRSPKNLPRASQIYNLACAASPPHYQQDPLYTVTTSTQGALRLLELAQAWGARLLQASTSEVYGDPIEHPQKESYFGNVNPIGPRACYDEGKRVAETLCFDFVRQGRADVRVARIFNTYGPRMRPDDGRIVSNLITQGLSGQPMTIYGKGEQSRSFCYVSDLIEGLFRLMQLQARPPGPVNLGNPEEYTILELAVAVQRLLGCSDALEHLPPVEDDPRRRCPDISRGKELLSWEPRVPLHQGLPPTVAWFRKALARDGTGAGGAAVAAQA
ncbi:MAG TPA: UDP-glucuronic acid decarboxylase family protein [Kiloniellales bacterium]|nr:UDP-glucuronic acid decarboxylase family protein [Kiloniellales bacterium]